MNKKFRKKINKQIQLFKALPQGGRGAGARAAQDFSSDSVYKKG